MTTGAERPSNSPTAVAPHWNWLHPGTWSWYAARCSRACPPRNYGRSAQWLRRSPTGSLPVRLVKRDDAADVVAVKHVLIALVDVFEPVGFGHHLVDVEQPGLVQTNELGRLDVGVAAAEDVALQRLLQHREQKQIELDVGVHHRAHAGHYAGAGLGGQDHRLF